MKTTFTLILTVLLLSPTSIFLSNAIAANPNLTLYQSVKIGSNENEEYIVLSSETEHQPAPSKSLKSVASIWVNVTAGELESALSSSDFKSITDLAITGTIDARDFRFLRDSMVFLNKIDLSGATISAFTGTGGTVASSTTYEANTIPSNAFFNAVKNVGKPLLTLVTIPSNTTAIGSYAFKGCTSLGVIDLPSSLISIGKEAFFGCRSITNFSLPASLTTIDPTAMIGILYGISVNANNPNFVSVDGILFNKDQTSLIKHPESYGGAYVVPSSVTTISDYAFFGNYNLTQLSLPSGLISIGVQAISSIKNVSSITIPKSVSSIGNYAFLDNNCSINVDPNNANYSSLDGLLYDKSQSTLIQCPTSKAGSLNISQNTAYINPLSFNNCVNLTNIILPSTITEIRNSAFRGCTKLATINIPSSVTSLQSGVFYNCTGLTSINTKRLTPINLTGALNVFYNVNKSTCTLNVPVGSLSSYQSAVQWKDFTNIVEVATAIPSSHTEKIEIKSINHNIVISGGSKDSSVKVFSLSGELVKTQNIEDSKTAITIAKGNYIVQIGDITQKVIVK